MQAAWSGFQPILEEPDDVLPEPRLSTQQSPPDVSPEEEQILYPRLTSSQLPPPTSSHSPSNPPPQAVSDRDGRCGLINEDDIPSSNGFSSPVCLSDASNKPFREVTRPATHFPESKLGPVGDHGKGQPFRVHRLMRDQVPMSDPETLSISTRTPFWQLRRESRTFSRTAWMANNPLRPKSPLHRIGSAFMPRNKDIGIPHFQRENSSVDDRSYLSPTDSEYHAKAKTRDLTGQVEPLFDHASAHGGFADVWMAFWASKRKKVAVKVLRLPIENECAIKKLRKRLRRELRVWRDLRHDNVLPLYGITTDFGVHLSMVCPWMENGTLNAYLGCQGMSLPLSARFKLLCEIAAGLSYLHMRGVIHGDLTGSNVLISASGKPYISDFGLSMILAEFQGTSYFTSSIRGTVRYAAPETYTFQDNEPAQSVHISTHSDIYSFGSVTLQTLSGKVPYYYIRKDAQVLWELFKGVCPQRPSESWVTDDHWRFIKECWKSVPGDRPAIADVVSYVRLRYNESCA